MKKVLSLILAAVLAMSVMTGCSASDSKEETKTDEFTLTMQIGNPVMTVNGKEMPIDDEGSVPVAVNSRTLLPVRAVVEEMGGTVGWDGTKNEVTLNYNGDEIKLTIGSATAYLNGNASTLDTAPAAINGRTMLPIRYIAESFKFDVGWEQKTKTVTIKKAVSGTETPIKQDETASGKNVLVVYFSATGSTKRAAEYIAKAADADIFEIEPVKEYTSADLNWNDSASRVSTEHNNPDMRNVELKTTDVPDWEKYDYVFIGYPIWWGIAAWPVNSFVSANDFEGKTVIPFCTSASSGIGSSDKELKSLTEGGEWLDGKRFSSGVSEQEVADWVRH